MAGRLDKFKVTKKYFQVKADKDTPYWKDETDQMGYRLHMMWDTKNYYYCGTGGVASVGFYHHKITKVHSEWMKQNQKRYFDKLMNNIKNFAHQEDILAGIEIGSGCLKNVTLKFARKKV